jgi:hypothetical protein
MRVRFGFSGRCQVLVFRVEGLLDEPEALAGLHAHKLPVDLLDFEADEVEHRPGAREAGEVGGGHVVVGELAPRCRGR